MTQGILSTLVLCVGENDYFAMETTHMPSTQHGDRNPCVDVPLLASVEKPSRTDLQLLPALDNLKSLLTSNAVPLPYEADAAFKRPWHSNLLVRDPILPSLRSVLLII